MAETNIPSGAAVTSLSGNLAIKHYSAALFANTLRNTTAMDNLMGPVEPTAAMSKVAGQTQPGVPIVRIDNLMKSPGDVVSLDLVDTIGGSPLMGDINREGMGKTLSFSSMEIKIDLSSQVVDAGGSMSQQRTRYQLREIALAQLSGYFPRLNAQTSLVMLGAGGASGYGLGNTPAIRFQLRLRHGQFRSSANL
jgi:hypothetical protein